jgi:PKD repeat protein
MTWLSRRFGCVCAIGLGFVIPSMLSPPGAADASSLVPRPSVRAVGAQFTIDVPIRFRLTVGGARVTRYSVDFGDGKVIRRHRRPPRTVVHAYASPGRYRVKFTITDGGGKRRTARRTLSVGAPPLEQEPSPQRGTSGPYISQEPPPPAPPPPNPGVPVNGNWMELPPGSSGSVEFDEDVKVSSIEGAVSAPAGVTVALGDKGVVISTSTDAAPSSATLIVDANGCVESDCDLRLQLWIPLDVVPLEAPELWLDEFTSPSPDRIANGIPVEEGVEALSDELLITLGTAAEPGTRDEADAVAGAVGGVVSGGLEAIGVFEIRWPQPQDISTRRTQLLAIAGVTSAGLSTHGRVEIDSVEPPGDWGDDGRQATWPFEQVRVGEAWDLTKGSDVAVGIVDGGLVYKKHEDLDVETSLYGHAGDHATHVAGLACAKANGIGLVGMAWGCPLVSSGVRSGWDKHVLEAAEAVGREPGVRVVNISMGYAYDGPSHDRCATAQQQQAKVAAGQEYKTAFRHLFNGWVGRNIVWTISGGNNCAEGAPGPMGANADLPNVITVAATNSDRSLASFSDFGSGVEIAAPGGVSVAPDGNGTVGVWSTWYENHCWPLGFGCGTYHAEYGTSMAAPIVAGIASLVRSAHPGYDAAAAAECITRTAGESTGLVESASSLPADGHVRHVAYVPNSLAIVDAEAAVDCDIFGPVDDADYLGKWGPPDHEVVSEGEAIMGIINEGETWYTNGCTDPPGQRTFSALTRQPNGQWSGDSITVTPDCTTHRYVPVASMRIVRGADGHPALVVAWNTAAAGSPPTIEADGTVITSYPFYEMRLDRRPGETSTSVAEDDAFRKPHSSSFGQDSGAAGLAVPGAVLRPATA